MNLPSVCVTSKQIKKKFFWRKSQCQSSIIFNHFLKSIRIIASSRITVFQTRLTNDIKPRTYQPFQGSPSKEVWLNKRILIFERSDPLPRCCQCCYCATFVQNKVEILADVTCSRLSDWYDGEITLFTVIVIYIDIPVRFFLILLTDVE